MCEAPRCILTGAMLGNADEILHAPPVTIGSDPRVDAEYRRLRRQVFIGIFIGYAAYYLVRNNLALAIPDILARAPGIHARRELGSALTGLSIAYGVSKFLMGSVSDRSNPEILPAARPAAVVRDHGVCGAVQGDLRIAGAGHRAADRQRLGAGHGLAAVRQDDGALVQHQGARAASCRSGTSAHNVGGGLVANLRRCSA